MGCRRTNPSDTQYYSGSHRLTSITNDMIFRNGFSGRSTTTYFVFANACAKLIWCAYLRLTPTFPISKRALSKAVCPDKYLSAHLISYPIFIKTCIWGRWFALPIKTLILLFWMFDYFRCMISKPALSMPHIPHDSSVSRFFKQIGHTKYSVLMFWYSSFKS